MNQFKHAKWWRSFLDKLKQAFSYTKASQQKERSKEKQREAKRKTEDSSCSLLWHFWSTSRSPFSTFYIPFQSSGSQESNASNRVRFGAEMRKIWPSEDNCSRLVRNSHNTFSLCEACAKIVQHSHNIRTTHAWCEFSSVFADSTLDLFLCIFWCNFLSYPCN